MLHMVDESALNAIDNLVEALLRSGVATRRSIHGCTEDEVTQVLRIAEGFPLPQQYIAFLLRMGRGAGRLLGGTDCLRL